MGPGKKLHAWRERRRAQQRSSPASQSSAASPPAASPPVASSAASSVSPSPTSAQASASSTAPAAVAASGAASQATSQKQPIHLLPPPASTLFPFMHVIERPDSAKKTTPPRLVYVALSVELRLLFADSASSVPTSLVDFRGADVCISLKRMSYEPPKASDPALPLDAVVAPRVCPETHSTGPAVRVTHKKRSILLVPATEEERDALLSALRLRVAPWPLLRQQMEAEMRAAAMSSASASSLADAARELLSGTGGAPSDSAGSSSDARGMGKAHVGNVVWEEDGTVAQMSLWAATFGQGLGSVVRTADELEKLAKPLGGLTVVGCAFSLVALSARVVSLMGMECEGRGQLFQAREDLREASVSLVGWLFSILRSGFDDEDGLVGKVFVVLGECWDGADELEQYLLHNWAIRAWQAEDIGIIVDKVGSVTGNLLATGLLNVVAKHERRIVGLEDKAFAADDFRSYAPTDSFDVGLVSNAATSLAQLKAAVLPTVSAEGSTRVDDSNDSGSSSSLRRVALTSVNGEGGVGKTSTCKLLCVDEDVRAYFLEGAILFIEVGQGASEEKVRNEVRKAVSKCGGRRAAEEIRSSTDVFESIDIARDFFSERRILVVADNVWETPTSFRVGNWAAALSKIASCPGSAVIMTTRFSSVSLSPGFDRVKLGRLDLATLSSPDWLVAENLYDVYLRSAPACVTRDEQSSDGYKRDRRKALELSCGVPLAITTFTGLVRSRLDASDDVESVLSGIEQQSFGLADWAVGEDLRGAIGHPGLFAAMEESLSYLDERERKARRVKSISLSIRKDVDMNDVRDFHSSYEAFSGESLSARYAALEMMPSSSTRMAFPLLCHLWHVPTVADAKSIALLFVNIGLGRIEGEEEKKAFILHDLQYSFCARICERFSGATVGTSAESVGNVNGHALFLSSCESLLVSELAGVDGDVDWAEFCFGEAPVLSEPLLRLYLRRNLFRHLCKAASGARQESADYDGVRGTIANVLTDFRWIRGRIAGDGRASAFWDFWYACTSRCSTESGNEAMLLDSDINNSIRAVWDGLLLLPDEGWMESDGTLAAYLVQIAQSRIERGDAGMGAYFFNNLTCSVANQVRGAWLDPIYGCSRARDEGVLAQAVVGSGSTVSSLAALGDGAHFISGSGDGVLRVHDCVYLQAVLELKEHTASINCAAVAKNDGVEGSIFLFSGSDDGTVRSWEVSLDPMEGVVEEARAVVGACESSVTCLAVSKGGDLIAAGCFGMVFIWKFQGGDGTFGFELVTSFRCSAVEEEPGWVCGVAVSRSGDLVVAGEQNGGIAFWSSEEVEVKGL